MYISYVYFVSRYTYMIGIFIKETLNETLRPSRYLTLSQSKWTLFLTWSATQQTAINYYYIMRNKSEKNKKNIKKRLWCFARGGIFMRRSPRPQSGTLGVFWARIKYSETFSRNANDGRSRVKNCWLHLNPTHNCQKVAGLQSGLLLACHRHYSATWRMCNALMPLMMLRRCTGSRNELAVIMSWTYENARCLYLKSAHNKAACQFLAEGQRW